tara:strand:- start:14850 stop:16493 length:1644 start_codon:yes stop_codon:yes gene_type:complete
MGYKTLTFSRQVEKRTYVQGEFTGKYHGIANDKILLSNTELYDIHIYEGEISNLKNDKQHPAIIDETIYNAIVSETQLTQKSFENVLINLNTTIQGYDSVRLEIIEPKLEAVQIYDVVKDGNKTFGTLICLVSGYLLEFETITDEMPVETCDTCNDLLEECTCNESTPVVFNAEPETSVIQEEIAREPIWKNVTNSFNKENRAKLWNEIQTSGLGCLGFIGLFLGILFLFSFGLPGLISGLLIGLLYLIGSFIGLFPSLPYHWRQLFYAFVGILIIGLLLNLFKNNDNYNYFNKSKTEISDTNRSDNEQLNDQPNSNSDEEFKIIRNNKNDNFKTDVLELEQEEKYTQNTDETPINQTVTLYNDSAEIYNNESIHTQAYQTESETNQISYTPNQILQDSLVTNTSSNSQKSETLLSSNPEETQKETDDLDTPNSFTKQITNEQSEINTNVDVATKETDAKNINQDITPLDTTETEALEQRKKLKPLPSVMAGTVFQEGDIYICKDDDSKHYHLNQNCEALEKCTGTIYQINIPEAERLGRSLCELEK